MTALHRTANRGLVALVVVALLATAWSTVRADNNHPPHAHALQDEAAVLLFGGVPPGWMRTGVQKSVNGANAAAATGGNVPPSFIDFAEASTAGAASGGSSSSDSSSSEGPTEEPTVEPSVFAAVFTALCPSAARRSVAALGAGRSEICCTQYNNESATAICGDGILVLRSMTVNCVAPVVEPAFTCCGSFSSSGAASYLSLRCKSGDAVTGIISVFFAAATAALVVVASFIA